MSAKLKQFRQVFSGLRKEVAFQPNIIDGVAY